MLTALTDTTDVKFQDLRTLAVKCAMAVHGVAEVALLGNGDAKRNMQLVQVWSLAEGYVLSKLEYTAYSHFNGTSTDL